ncbi:MAG: response regulator transcription factor [Chloroflexi bacterium]|nr:response regulator transcription factor [Chloroflexota bacterium]
MSQIQVLVVDDEPRYLKLLRYNLEQSGYQVVTAATGEEAIKAAATGNPGLVLLDLRLPDMDGYEVCRRLREFSTAPIIMVTARAEVVDKVRGLKVGADDYVTKPFSPDELLARVETVLRRSRFPSEAHAVSRLTIGELAIDFVRRAVTVEGNEIILTPVEYRLLHCLATNFGRVMTPGEIQKRVWGSGYQEYYEGLRAHIHRLRQKIEKDLERPTYIITKHGVGYMLAHNTTQPAKTDSEGEL